MHLLFADSTADQMIAELESRGHRCSVEPALTTTQLPDRIAGVDVLVVRSTKVDRAAFEAADKLAQRFGAVSLTLDGVAGVGFVVWAPNAQRVSVVGDFNTWDGRRHAMRVRGNGYWEIFVPGAQASDKYKYEIIARAGDLLLDREAWDAPGSLLYVRRWGPAGGE